MVKNHFPCVYVLVHTASQVNFLSVLMLYEFVCIWKCMWVRMYMCTCTCMYECKNAYYILQSTENIFVIKLLLNLHVPKVKQNTFLLKHILLFYWHSTICTYCTCNFTNIINNSIFTSSLFLLFLLFLISLYLIKRT